jgi:hypothetical protein
MMARTLERRIADLERGTKSSLPLVITEDCDGREQIIAKAEQQGRAVVRVSAIDERL